MREGGARPLRADPAPRLRQGAPHQEDPLNHDEAVLLLHDLPHGRLDPELESDLTAHLSVCEECRLQTETYSLLRANFDAVGDALRAHPPSDVLVAFALRPDDLPRTQRSSLTSHIVSCALCASAVEETRSAVPEAAPLRPVRGFTPVLRIPRWPLSYAAAAAAVLIVAALAYSSYLGFYRLPREQNELARMRSEIDQFRDELAGSTPYKLDPLSLAPQAGIDHRWSGVASILDLDGSQPPGTKAAPSLRVGRDEPFALLVLHPRLLGEVSSGGGEVYFEIRSGPRPVWSATLTRERLRAELDSPHGAVIFPVPANDLSEGSYEMTIRDDGPAGRERLRLPFTVAR